MLGYTTANIQEVVVAKGDATLYSADCENPHPPQGEEQESELLREFMKFA